MDKSSEASKLFGGLLLVVMLLVTVWSCGFSSSFTGNSGEPLAEHLVGIPERLCSEFQNLIPRPSYGYGSAFDLNLAKPVIWITMPDNRETYFIATYRRTPNKKKCVSLQEVGRDPIGTKSPNRLSDKWNAAESRAFKTHEVEYRANRWLTIWTEFCRTEPAYKKSVLCLTKP